MDELITLPNVGKELSAKLREIGISSSDELRQTGTEQIFIRLKVVDPEACFCKLCAIEGAVQGIRWHNLPPERKNELKQFFQLINKSIIFKK
jgi:DNA transformation protein